MQAYISYITFCNVLIPMGCSIWLCTLLFYFYYGFIAKWPLNLSLFAFLSELFLCKLLKYRAILLLIYQGIVYDKRFAINQIIIQFWDITCFGNTYGRFAIKRIIKFYSLYVISRIG